MSRIILITGASSGFGRLTTEALGRAGHAAYASMRDVAGRNAKNAAELSALAGTDIRPIELDVQSEASANAVVEKIIAECGRIDVLIHNAGHMMFGPAEAFTPGAIRPAVRRQCAGDATGQSCRAAAHALGQGRLDPDRRASPRPYPWEPEGEVPSGDPTEQQLGQWHPALPGALFCGQSRHGRACRALGPRAGALGHRDIDRRARRLHQRH
jgi:NAD(P)-dependent dehydrogenase (short-subunit alcohol dehydrogenase family)